MRENEETYEDSFDNEIEGLLLHIDDRNVGDVQHNVKCIKKCPMKKSSPNQQYKE